MMMLTYLAGEFLVFLQEKLTLCTTVIHYVCVHGEHVVQSIVCAYCRITFLCTCTYTYTNH